MMQNSPETPGSAVRPIEIRAATTAAKLITIGNRRSVAV